MDNKKSPHHLTPIPVYFKTLGALLVLTMLTVAASYIDFGKANIFVSLGIATIKATLVMLFFMGLKYDNALNRATIISSFIGLAIFLWLSASDLWTRGTNIPVKVDHAANAVSMDEFVKMEVATPAMVEKGKELFALNCAICHGPQGNGDGIGGSALNPKPRNFHGPRAAWKNGPSVKSMYVTLTYGVPGSGMASYKAIPPKDRLALIHFVRNWVPEPPSTAQADGRIDQAMKEDGIGGGGGAVKATIPIDIAIDHMAK